MVLTADRSCVAVVHVFVEPENDSVRSTQKAENYFKRNGWKQDFFSFSPFTYHGKKFWSRSTFRKSFPDIETMNAELLNINDAFNSFSEMLSYDSKQCVPYW